MLMTIKSDGYSFAQSIYPFTNDPQEMITKCRFKGMIKSIHTDIITVQRATDDIEDYLRMVLRYL